MQGTARPDWRRIYRKKPSVSRRQVHGETFLVPVEDELARMHRMVALNPIGAFIWDELDGERDLAAIHRELIETFEVSAEEAREDLSDYVERLLAAGLVELREEAAKR